MPGIKLLRDIDWRDEQLHTALDDRGPDWG